MQNLKYNIVCIVLINVKEGGIYMWCLQEKDGWRNIKWVNNYDNSDGFKFFINILR